MTAESRRQPQWEINQSKVAFNNKYSYDFTRNSQRPMYLNEAEAFLFAAINGYQGLMPYIQSDAY